MSRRIVLAVIALFALALTGIAGQGDGEQEILQLENDWNNAVLKKDRAALQSLYATEYLYTDSDGVTHTKSQDIADVVSAVSHTESFALSDLKVNVYGAGAAAVVTGRNTIKASFRSKDVSGTYRFTDVFVKRNGRWQVVATQSTKVTSRKVATLKRDHA